MNPIEKNEVRGASKTWIWVVVACLAQVIAWTAWITVASRHKVQEVPLAHAVPAMPKH